MHSKRYLLLFLIIVSAISTLISGFFLFAQQNEYTLAEAIEQKQVTAQIGGIAEDGRFLQPMLQVRLTKQTIWPLTVVIPQGLLLSTSSAAAAVVTVQTQKVTLLRGERTTKVFAYSLEYNKSFPSSSSQYQAQAVPISEDVTTVLNNIVALQAEYEIASQLAVWQAYQKVELAEIALGRDLSEYRNRVDEIVGSDLGSVGVGSGSWRRWATVISISVALLTFCFSTFFLWSNPHPPAAFARLRRPEGRGGERTKYDHYKRLFSPLALWDAAGEQKRVGGVRAGAGAGGESRATGLIDQLTDWQLVSKGEMTEVWSAFDKRAGKNESVIVKFPRRDSSSINPRNIHYRFEKGIQHLQQMTHPHIAQLIESGECLHPRDGQQTLYLIQEFVDGSTLDEILQERNYESLDTLSIMRIVAQLSEALKGIHQKKVVYRNISLNNIMVDKRGQVYLTDFANTTLFDSSETGDMGLSPVGTFPFYAPPDLIGNVPARDYYSLAMLIVAMYVGKPITGLSGQEVKYHAEYLYKTQKGVPKSVRSVLEWCLNIGYHKVSTEIRHDFSTPRQLLATMVEEIKNK